ncbi:hypothetical protein BH11PSE14_BH11PSE14_02300 [soil metagenome]
MYGIGEGIFAGLVATIVMSVLMVMKDAMWTALFATCQSGVVAPDHHPHQFRQ